MMLVNEWLDAVDIPLPCPNCDQVMRLKLGALRLQPVHRIPCPACQAVLLVDAAAAMRAVQVYLQQTGGALLEDTAARLPATLPVTITQLQPGT